MKTPEQITIDSVTVLERYLNHQRDLHRHVFNPTPEREYQAGLGLVEAMRLEIAEERWKIADLHRPLHPEGFPGDPASAETVAYHVLPLMWALYGLATDTNVASGDRTVGDRRQALERHQIVPYWPLPGQSHRLLLTVPLHHYTPYPSVDVYLALSLPPEMDEVPWVDIGSQLVHADSPLPTDCRLRLFRAYSPGSFETYIPPEQLNYSGTRALVDEVSLDNKLSTSALINWCVLMANHLGLTPKHFTTGLVGQHFDTVPNWIAGKSRSPHSSSRNSGSSTQPPT